MTAAICCRFLLINGPHEKALGRYRKVLALTSSPNPHEAEAAARHAKALERRYGFSPIQRPDTTTCTPSLRYRSLPTYLSELIDALAFLYGCSLTDGHRLIGQGERPRQCADVVVQVIDQLRSARRQYFRTAMIGKRKFVGRSSRHRRGFDRGWCMGVLLVIGDFDESPEGVADAESDCQSSAGAAPDEMSAYLLPNEKPGRAYFAGLHIGAEMAPILTPILLSRR